MLNLWGGEHKFLSFCSLYEIYLYFCIQIDGMNNHYELRDTEIKIEYRTEDITQVKVKILTKTASGCHERA